MTDERLELGKALLANIDAHRSNPDARRDAIAAAVLKTEHTEIETKFFADLDAMRESDPDASLACRRR